MIRDKSKLLLGIPELSPDKVVATFSGSFVTTNAASPGFGALYEGIVTIPNTYGATAYPISQFTTDGSTYYTDFAQFVDVVVVTAVTASQIKYRWASNSFPFTVQYQTALLSLS